MANYHSKAEKYWQTNQAWLKSRGYQLRSRYQPDWTPSWITNPPADPVFGIWKREDYINMTAPQIMDAIRIEDGTPVILKRVYKLGNEYNQEVEISTYLSSPELLKDPHNHCIPVYELLEIPDDDKFSILVLPLLRPFNSPRFDTIGECLDFFQQIFKGLQFIHRHHIAHRDCTGPNVMMDGSELYPNGFHPIEYDYDRDFTGPAEQVYTRSQRPPKYYWIDLGNSARFDPSDRSPRIAPLHGTDKSAPEFQDPNPDEQKFDPFPTDIYYLGNLIRIHFTEGHVELGYPRIYGVDFLKPLIDDMVREDPKKRPNIDQCVVQLDDIIRNQSSWTLRSQVWHRDDHIFGIICRLFPHWARRIYYIITQTPPIPHRDD